jgi:hypothetical protein
MKRNGSQGVSIPAWHVAVIVLLMAAQIACGALASVSSSDTNRDIFLAQQIASGAYFPLTGPDITGVLHLGPLWFYVLALVAWLPNAAFVTAAMAAISASQFPLAYVLARRVALPGAAIFFVLALAIPSWVIASFAAMTHTLAVVPSLLFGALVAHGYRRNPDLKHALLLGVACACMMTAHPTLVVMAGALLIWSAAAASRRLWLPHGAIVAAVAALTLAPMVYEQWRDGFADVATATRYVHTDWNPPSVFDALRLLRAIVEFAPRYFNHFWLEFPSGLALGLQTVYLALLLAAGVGIVLRLVESDRRGLIAALCGLLLVQSLFVCAIRNVMPPWMVYAHWPLICALLAIGLDRCSRADAGRALVMAALAITTAWTLSLYAYLASGPLDHTEIKPSPGKHALLDIREYEENELHYRLARVPFRQLYAVGAPLCEPVTLYGHYAYLMDYTFAVAAAVDCGSTRNVEFGGMPHTGRKAILGLHESAWEQLHMTPQQRLGVFGLTAPEAVWHSPVALAPVIPRLTNWPRKLQLATEHFVVSGTALSDAAVLVSHRAHRYATFKVVAARADGNEIVPAYADETAVVFRVPDGEKRTIHWEIDIDAMSDYVDVLTFESAGNSPPG